MLPLDEQEKQNAWFGSVEEHKIAFVEETNKWLLEVPDTSEKGIVAPGFGSVSNEEACIFKIVENAVEDDIRPSDSVSNVSVRSKKRRTVVSKSMSTTSSARIKAEAETAALIARQRLLSQKHALEEQQELLRKKGKELELDMELAAAMAKVSVFKASEGSHLSKVSVRSDGMNSYLERGKRTQLNTEAATFVPAFNTQSSSVEAGGEALLSGYATVRSETRNKIDRPAAVVRAGPSTLISLPAAATGLGMPTLSECAFHPAVTYLQPEAAPVTVDNSDQRFLTVLERQNQITSLLVGQ